jgi:hypothetical protein
MMKWIFARLPASAAQSGAIARAARMAKMIRCVFIVLEAGCFTRAKPFSFLRAYFRIR